MSVIARVGQRGIWGAVVAVIALGGWALQHRQVTPPPPVAATKADPPKSTTPPLDHKSTTPPLAPKSATPPLDHAVHQRFQQGVTMLHAGQYQMAMVAFHEVLQRAPNMAEAYVNMGFAMVGLQQFKAAADFFLGAVDLRPSLANAYYGLALALEGMNDLAGALGAMRSYIHLTRAEDPYLPKARAALWEWESQLGRDPMLEPLRKPSPPQE